MAGETVMLGIDLDDYFGLNGIGTRVWNLLEKDMAVQEICTILRSEYDVNDARCQDDVLRFLQELLDYHLIEVS